MGIARPDDEGLAVWSEDACQVAGFTAGGCADAGAGNWRAMALLDRLDRKSNPSQFWKCLQVFDSRVINGRSEWI